MLDEINYNNENEMEELLAKMHYELILEMVDEQIQHSFNKSKRNFLELYHDKYKFLKKEYDDDEFLSELSAKHHTTFEMVLDKLEEKFKFTVDRDNVKITKAVIVLYNFFVINYEANLTKLVINFILKNKKHIIPELKNLKNKTRDVSYNTSKVLFNNANEGLMMNNLNAIIFDIMPGFYDKDDCLDFLKLMSDDDYVTISVIEMFNEMLIECDENLYDVFIEPLIEKEDGYSNIISNVITVLYSKFKKQADLKIV